MKDEIKEILDYFKREDKNQLGFNQDKLLSYEEAKLLLDYITNLQQENERLKMNKINDYMSKDNTYYKEAMIYKSRNEKTIKYIKSHKQRYDIDGSIADLDEFDILASPKTLLKIINGGDDNDIGSNR